jgi:superfamily I DNA/RNA helicase
MERELAQGLKPERLAYLSFTVEGRKVAKSRALKRFSSLTENQLIFFSTIHSICYRQMGLAKEFVVKGPKDLEDFAERYGIEFSKSARTMDWETESCMPTGGYEMGDQMLAFDHWRRHRKLDLESAHKLWPDYLDYWELQRFSVGYRRWKDNEGYYDFTDFLAGEVAPLPVDVVIVDEAQDLSPLQWDCLERLAANAKRVYVAGDDDQAIFSWAGADPHHFIDLQGRKTVLDQSFRLPARVHALAGSVVHQISKRQPKRFRPRAVEGRVNYYESINEVDLEGSGDWLLLVRNHYLARGVEQHLRDNGLPYQRGGELAVAGDYSRAIVFWERLRAGKPQPKEAVTTILEAVSVKRGVRVEHKKSQQKQYTLADLKELYGVVDQGPWFDSLTKISEEDSAYLRAILRRFGPEGIKSRPRIRLSTIHAAKGAEADNVVLLTDMSRKTEDALETHRDDELRVWYVGITRAKESLHVVGTNSVISVV